VEEVTLPVAPPAVQEVAQEVTLPVAPALPVAPPVAPEVKKGKK
jgi:hypothetical protein